MVFTVDCIVTKNLNVHLIPAAHKILSIMDFIVHAYPRPFNADKPSAYRPYFLLKQFHGRFKSQWLCRCALLLDLHVAVGANFSIAPCIIHMSHRTSC